MKPNFFCVNTLLIGEDNVKFFKKGKIIRFKENIELFCDISTIH